MKNAYNSLKKNYKKINFQQIYLEKNTEKKMLLINNYKLSKIFQDL